MERWIIPAIQGDRDLPSTELTKQKSHIPHTPSQPPQILAHSRISLSFNPVLTHFEFTFFMNLPKSLQPSHISFVRVPLFLLVYTLRG